LSARVAWISYCPVKGLAVQQLARCELTEAGVAGDRQFFLVDENDRLVNSKGLGVLQQIVPRYDDQADSLTLSFPDVGPPITLSPKGAVALGMAIHELATNAAKYGALSAKNGTVTIDWAIEDGRLCIRWSERGGPPVAKPSRSGFGRVLLERALASDLEAEVTLDFAPEGLTCAIALPLGDDVARTT